MTSNQQPPGNPPDDAFEEPERIFPRLRPFSNSLDGNPVAFAQLFDHMKSVVGGAICSVDGQVYFVSELEQPRLIKNANELFALIAHSAAITWSSGTRHLSKDVFFEYVRQHAQTVVGIERYPHFPPILGMEYAHPNLPCLGRGRLDQMLSHFRPASPADGILLRSFVLTLCWGGPGGSVRCSL